MFRPQVSPYHPLLIHAVGGGVWLFVVLLQLIYRRVMAMQFGLIALFSNVLPVISLFCFLANIIKLKAIQLEFRYKKRGDPELSFGIGQFMGIFEFISHAAILINVSIGAFTSTRYAAMAEWESVQLSDVQVLLGFVAVEHVLLFLKMFIAV